MNVPSKLRIRIVSWLSVSVLTAASVLTLVYVLPYQGLAQLPADPVHVFGQGVAEFRQDPGGPVPACTFDVDAQDSEPVTGTLTCTMSDEALALGIPVQSVDGEVSDIDQLAEQTARLTGTATLGLPDGSELEGIQFSLTVVAGGPDEGSLRIRLIDVFDGEPGDGNPGNGDYDQWRQILTEGSLDIEIGPSPSPSPSESSSPSPTPSESPSPTPSSSPSPTPSSSPSPTPTGTPSPTPTISSSPSPAPLPTGTGTPPGTGIVEDAPIPDTGARSTARLMALLSQISFDRAPHLVDTLSVVGPFPVAGLTWWTNDWHAYRCCPYPHVHQGLDMFASVGTPVVAAADGYVSQKVDDPLMTGLGIEITDAADTQYFYAHLSAFAPGLDVGQRVHVGEVIGYVGNTGNASETAPHLHFEIQPNGVPEPPKPVVDGWLVLAERKAEALVASRTGRPVLNPADYAHWLALALALQPPQPAITGEASSGLDGAGRGSAVAATAVSPSAAAMVAIASILLLTLLVAPACALGRRDARRAGAGPGDAAYSVRLRSAQPFHLPPA